MLDLVYPDGYTPHMKIVFYTKESGKEPVNDFISVLPVKDRARVLACLKSIEELGFDTSDWGLEFTEEEEPELEIIDTDTQQNIEKYKQLIFLYEDASKYAHHWKIVQAIKYDFGFDSDDQIVEYLLSLHEKKK